MATARPLSSGCGLCGRTMYLQRCGGCNVMCYCNRDHQATDRPRHKIACKAVSKTRAKYEDEEQSLRNAPPDFMTPENVFETSVGHFWGILATRDYMRARLAFADALGKVKTKQAVQEQLGHLMDMLRLCRGDNLGVRALIPALMLRLNKDQQCYDFVKWWTLISDERDYDWGNTDLPYLDIKNADPFEDVNYLDRRGMELSHVVAVTLLKVKLVLDLQALENTTDVAGKEVPQEILNKIRSQAVTSPIIAGNREILERHDHHAATTLLTKQIRALYMAVDKANEHFWDSLVLYEKPELPEAFSRGSWEEAQLTLHYSYDSWWECPGALRFIEKIMDESD
ncbi:hypothetical protein V1520DRAFT_348690 [Lipomyces starkeyi]|uniref:MYND-type domain-containing protein n=1 Tax=Lipomyces starkeyi NRRL Y-11557 TaxID=675824 RepID=A0A1E3QAF1_LIPST|nr:hypothetical protein LIPSTDRAFT_102765 [Lipomyces starkeyi NRRL Y-11557]